MFQAFIVSLLSQLKTSKTLTSPGKVSGIVDVDKRNTAIDAGLNPLDLVKTAQAVQGNLSFFTLPVERFDNVHGQDVNIVDIPRIRAIVKGQLDPDAEPSSVPTPTPKPTPAIVGHGQSVDVVNASGVAGAARAVQESLTDKGFTAGAVGNASATTRSEVAHAPGEAEHATKLAAYLGGLPVREDKGLHRGQLKVILGSGFEPPPWLAGAATGPTPTTTSGPASTEPVDATGGGAAGPPPTALTELAASGIPCVK